MKRALILSMILAFTTLVKAQVIKTSEGSIDFLAKATVVGFEFDWTTAKVNGIDGMQGYIDYRYEELLLEENKKQADKWKEGWNETISTAEKEFVLVLNEELKKVPLNFKQGGKGKYNVVFKISDFTSGKLNFMGASADNFATFEGQMIFTDESGTQVAVVDFIGWKGNPSTTVYTMGDGYRVNSLFKKAGVKFGLKIYNTYFKKKK